MVNLLNVKQDAFTSFLWMPRPLERRPASPPARASRSGRWRPLQSFIQRLASQMCF